MMCVFGMTGEYPANAYEIDFPEEIYVVVGVKYGVEAYLVVSLELQENEAGTTEAESFLSSFVTKLSNALKDENDDVLIKFKQQILQEEAKVSRLKFRLYADLHGKPLPECGFHEFTLQQIPKIDAGNNKVVPISYLLCPMRNVTDNMSTFG